MDPSASLKVAVLTVSDTCATDPASDKSGPLAESLLKQASSNFEIHARTIVPDEPDAIYALVKKWIDEDRVALVVTTGGTGFGVRDGTPEALAPLIDKPTPALTHALTALSLSKTPFAALSRSVTGVRHYRSEDAASQSSTSIIAPFHGRKGALIVALPGSSKAVSECFEVLLARGLLPHALELLSGGSGKGTHKKMQRTGAAASGTGTVALDGTETDTGRAHHGHGCGRDHGHGHHAPVPRTAQSGYVTKDPDSSTAQRHRVSPYPIISMSEALQLIESNTPGEAPVITRPVDPDLAGYVLAEDIRATGAIPPRPTTNVDGYAVKASVTPEGVYGVLRESDKAPDQGFVVRINTGQPLPPGTDAVVMVEDTELVEETDGEELKVKVLAQVEVGENVRPAGSDVKEGAVVLSKGTSISSLGGEIGTLVFVARSQVKVYRKPVVALLSTGNELLDISKADSASATDAWGFRIYDANRPGLRAAIESMGFEVRDLGIVGDDLETTVSALQKGLAEADVVITTGGTSMGEADLLKPIIERRLAGGRIHFGRVAMKPGKPTTFATVSSRLLFALPGNPASALVCFYVFVLPALRKLAGYPGATSTSMSPHSLPRIKVRIQTAMRLDPRPEFHRVVLRPGTDGVLVASSTGSQRSSGMHSMATANALVCLPALAQGQPSSLPAHSLVDAMLLGPLA